MRRRLHPEASDSREQRRDFDLASFDQPLNFPAQHDTVGHVARIDLSEPRTKREASDRHGYSMKLTKPWARSRRCIRNNLRAVRGSETAAASRTTP